MMHFSRAGIFLAGLALGCGDQGAAPGEGGGAGKNGAAAGGSAVGNPGGFGQSGNAAPASSGAGGGSAGAAGAGGATEVVDSGRPEAGGPTLDAAQMDAASGPGAPLEECTQPSIDRLEQWNASGEGTTVPKTGSILVKEGDHYAAKVQLVDDGQWKVVPVMIANKFGSGVDLSKSGGFWLTYSATADFYVQLRSVDQWNGGNQYATKIPSTNGATEQTFFSFEASKYKSLFGQPVMTLPATLQQVQGFVFVGQGANAISFTGLRIDGYVPPCR